MRGPDPSPTVPDMGKAALWYASHGIPIFPIHWPTGGGCSCGKPDCHSPGKHPLTPRGFKDATIDLAQVASWWRQWPNANIGIPTGSASGCLVVDCDPRNGGPASPDEFVQRFGPLPDGTPIIDTGGGGMHLPLRYDGGAVQKELGKGVDLKGDGGYVVAPPSLHASGRRYMPRGARDTLLSPPEAPAWLTARISTHRDAQPADPTVGGNADGAKLTEGGRNNGLMSLAGSMRARGFSRKAIEGALLAENPQLCDPPLPEREVRSIAASVSRYPTANTTTAAAPNGGEKGTDCLPDTARAQWPDPLNEEAFHGIAGEWVRLVEPHTEADSAALLVQILVAFGNLIGRGAHFQAEADRHFSNLFAVVVGQTAKGRKGTSWGHVRAALEAIDADWARSHIMGGLSSGEGLIWAVRDEIRERVPVKERGQVVRHEEQVTDAGVADKRLLVIESEFASVLQRAEREANTLSAIIRQSWDDGNLRTLTKKQAAQATGAHISIVGHITAGELRRRLNSTEAGNGFANRFLWVCAKRSKCLPDGGALGQVDSSGLTRRLQAVTDFARNVTQMERDEGARQIWHRVYPELSEGKLGLFGAVTSRAEAQVLRLSCLYALLDCSAVVRAEDLTAALAVWQYCEASARFIFGDSLGDGTADEILRELRRHPEGMTRNEIREHFSRNKLSPEVGRALVVLLEHGLARVVRNREDEGPGRPTERWFAVSGLRG